MSIEQAFTDTWDARLKTETNRLQEASGAKAVLIAVFDPPWLSSKEGSLMGMAGRTDADPFRVARELRAIADMLEKHAGKIEAGVAHTDEAVLAHPQRD